MSIAGILSSTLFSAHSQRVHDRIQQFRQDFQKLGQDLQTGNLTGAQADFAALQKDGPQPSSSTQNSNPIARELQQLSTDLQSGNLTATQQDYTNLQQDFKNQAAQRPHHHHPSSGSQDNSVIAQLFSQIGQDLQSGDMTSAQPAYTTLQQDLQQYALSHGALHGVASSGVSETA
jgi:outer membrane protein assembly factor BamD (BamD/ComL family)